MQILQRKSLFLKIIIKSDQEKYQVLMESNFQKISDLATVKTEFDGLFELKLLMIDLDRFSKLVDLELKKKNDYDSNKTKDNEEVKEL